MTKQCGRCSESKTIESFSVNRRNKDGRQAWCKTCAQSKEVEYRETRRNYRRVYLKERYQTEDGRRKQLNAYFKYEYGFSLEGYERLMEAQGNKCAICGETPKRHRLYVDHCHSTGQVRGLLCFHCNTALGHFNDDPRILEAALRYLDKK